MYIDRYIFGGAGSEIELRCVFAMRSSHAVQQKTGCARAMTLEDDVERWHSQDGWGVDFSRPDEETMRDEKEVMRHYERGVFASAAQAASMGLFVPCASRTSMIEMQRAVALQRNLWKLLLSRCGDVERVDETAFIGPEATTEQGELLMSLLRKANGNTGQKLVSDFILSLRLPRSHVGVRRTAAISVPKLESLGQLHHEVIQRAHEVCMTGSEEIWSTRDQPDEQINCIAVLLAGLAVHFAESNRAVRNNCAFGGVVTTPFTECERAIVSSQETRGRDGHGPAATRHVIVCTRGYFFLVGTTDSLPRRLESVLCYGKGLSGLCACALMLMTLQEEDRSTRRRS